MSYEKKLKIILWIAGSIVAVIAGLILYIQLTWNKTFDAPYPDIKASNDPAMIERGRYLAYGWSHCAACHVPADKVMDIDNGLQMPLIGGWGEFVPGFGTFYAPNLTPDTKTGAIASWSEQQFVDRFQGGRLYEGSPMPWGMFSRMSESDLKALYKYLHSLDPVEFSVEKTVYAPGEETPK